MLADLGELVDPRGRLGRIECAGLADQVAGLILVASYRHGDREVEDGGRRLGDGCRRLVQATSAAGPTLAASDRMASVCSRLGNRPGSARASKTGSASPDLARSSSAVARWAATACWSSCSASSSSASATVSVSRSSRRSASRAADGRGQRRRTHGPGWPAAAAGRRLRRRPVALPGAAPRTGPLRPRARSAVPRPQLCRRRLEQFGMSREVVALCGVGIGRHPRLGAAPAAHGPR